MQRKDKYKSKEEKLRLEKKEELRRLNQLVDETEDIDTIVELSRHEDENLRFKAVKQLCPCKVQKDIPEFWKRVFEMVDDPSARIRMQILHIMCDGSPEHVEANIKVALEKFNQDEDPDIRRRAHKVLVSFNRDGYWNIL